MSNIFVHPATPVWQAKVMAAKIGMFPIHRAGDHKVILVVPDKNTPKGIIENMAILKEVKLND